MPDHPSFEDMETFVKNIDARGPKSGVPFEDTLGGVMSVEIFARWRAMLMKEAIEIATDEAHERMRDGLELDPENPEHAAPIMTMIMLLAVEHCVTAGFAGGLFTGMAHGPGDGPLVITEKNGWGDES